jgi:DNA primase
LGLIPEDKIAEIRDRTDIVQVVGEYVTLKRSGVNHKGLCPFHNEKSPSFNVNAQKQFFKCFGCGKSGDVYTFLTEIEGKSFVEVARELGRKAGVELPEPPRDPAAQKRAAEAESERARMVRLNDLTAAFYVAQLEAPVGERARAYLDKRGIGPRVRETFRVGYAPAGWDALVRHLEAKRVPHELAERAGLVRARDRVQLGPGAPPSKATHFDVFVDRVVYALTSPVGEIIGFGGRVLEAVEDQPKYKNSPETLLYKKGENLFGLHAAKHAIRRGGRALVVEGNFDVMTLHEHGLDFAVAPQGTAITDAQVALLGRFAKEVVLMLDADPAGRAATLKVVHRFVATEIKARIAQLRPANGQKVDPDDLARNDLPRLKQMIDGAEDAVEFFFTQVASTSEKTVPGKVAAINECLPILRDIRDPLTRDLYVERLGALLSVDAGKIRALLRGGRPVVAAPATAPPEKAPQRQIDPAHAKLLAFLGQHATLISLVEPDVVASIADPQVRALVEDARAQGSFSPQAVLARCPAEIHDAVARALLSDEFASDDEPHKRRMFRELTGRLRLPTDGYAALEAERQQAIARGDDELVRTLTARIRSLSTRMQGETSR